MKFITLIVSLLVISICVNAFSIESDKRHKKAKVPNTSSTQNTASNDDNNGNIFYLDRHNVACTGNSAINWFHLARQGTDKINYDFQCLKSDALSTVVQTLNTPFNATDGDKSVNFLDRHNVNCPDGTVLQSFHFNRNTANTSQIRYTYTCIKAETLCCKLYTTNKESSGDQQIIYLDRQSIGNKDIGSTSVLSQFKAWASNSPNQMWYTYTLCKLKDMDIAKALISAQSAVLASQLAITKAQKDLDDAKLLFTTNTQVADSLMKSPGLAATC